MNSSLLVLSALLSDLSQLKISLFFIILLFIVYFLFKFPTYSFDDLGRFVSRSFNVCSFRYSNGRACPAYARGCRRIAGRGDNAIGRSCCDGFAVRGC